MLIFNYWLSIIFPKKLHHRYLTKSYIQPCIKGFKVGNLLGVFKGKNEDSVTMREIHSKFKTNIAPERRQTKLMSIVNPRNKTIKNSIINSLDKNMLKVIQKNPKVHWRSSLSELPWNRYFSIWLLGLSVLLYRLSRWKFISRLQMMSLWCLTRILHNIQ